MGQWEGTYCACGALLDKEIARGLTHRIAGRYVCGACWKKPRIAPSLLKTELNNIYGKVASAR
jgi:hypothetical protein